MSITGLYDQDVSQVYGGLMTKIDRDVFPSKHYKHALNTKFF